MQQQWESHTIHSIAKGAETLEVGSISKAVKTNFWRARDVYGRVRRQGLTYLVKYSHR